MITKILLSLILSANSFGGIRVGGNPSGYIENQIVYTWTNFYSTVTKCLGTPSCASQNTEFLTTLQIMMEQKKISLRFADDQAGLENRNGIYTLILSAKKLYEVYRDPVQFKLVDGYKEILSGLSAFSQGLSQEEILSLATALFQVSFQNEKTFGTEAFGLQGLYFKLIGTSAQQLLISDERGLHALNAFIEQKLPCKGSIHQYKGFNIVGYNRASSSLALETEIQWSCQRTKHSADVFMLFPVKHMDPAGPILGLPDLKLTIRNQRTK